MCETRASSGNVFEEDLNPESFVKVLMDFLKNFFSPILLYDGQLWAIVERRASPDVNIFFSFQRPLKAKKWSWACKPSQAPSGVRTGNILIPSQGLKPRGHSLQIWKSVNQIKGKKQLTDFRTSPTHFRQFYKLEKDRIQKGIYQQIKKCSHWS